MTRCAAAVAALAAVVVAGPPARAAVTVVTGGVRGGQVNGLSWDPTRASTVWAAVLGTGLYKSDNGGAAWTQLILPGVVKHPATRVLASRAAADLVFVCDGAPSLSSIWRSGNAGGSFAGVLPSTAGDCGALADGATAGTLFAGIGGNVYKSIDAGNTWSVTPFNAGGAAVVSDLVQLAGGRVVAGTRATGGGSIRYSDDGGATWMASTGTGAKSILALAGNGTDRVLALASDGNGAAIYTSADGTTFTSSLTLAAAATSGRLAYHAGSDSFFALANDQLLESSNAAGGYSFGSATDRAAGLAAPVPLSLGHHAAFAVDPADAMHLLVGDVGGGEGLFASADGGGVWVVSDDGLFAQRVTRAVKTPSGYRYAANLSGFVYFSASSATAPWTRLFRPTDVTHDGVIALAVDAADDKRVVIASWDGGTAPLLRALPDATATGEDMAPFAHSAWQTLTYPDAANSPAPALLVDGMTLFAGVVHQQNATGGAYLYRSANGGTTWAATSLSVVGGVRALAFDPSNRQIVYAGAGDYATGLDRVAHAGGLWKSTDGGDSWSRISAGNATLDGEAPRTIIVDPQNGMRLWVLADRALSATGTDADLFESLDGGASWTTITPASAVLQLTYSPAEGLLAYASPAPNVDVFVQPPGLGAALWSGGFGVYGSPAALYAGSIGVGTDTGLFEASGVQFTPDDMGAADDAGGDDGMLPGDVVDAGGKLPSGGGCGCALVPTSGATASGLLLALAFARLLFRRRAARARPRA